MELFVQICIAVFAVFGFCSGVHTLLDLLFLPKQLAVAVKLECTEDIEDLDLLLSQARTFGGGCAKHPPVVLLSADLARDAVSDILVKERCIEIMERYCADCYVVETDSKN
jgi:hypothetical protein